MALFPRFTASLLCDRSEQEVVRRIQETFMPDKRQVLGTVVINAPKQELEVISHPHGIIERNAFLPDTFIRITGSQAGTQLALVFVLKNSTKVLLSIFYSICLLFEIMVFVFSLMNKLLLPLPVLFPLILALSGWILCVCSFRFSTKRVFQTIVASISQGDNKEPILTNAIFLYKR